MWIPDYTKLTNDDVIYHIVRRFPLATVIVHDGSGVHVDHLPVTVAPSAPFPASGSVLSAHVSRENSLADVLREGAHVTLVFHGPQNYISPAWYPDVHDAMAVPTWNYIVIHVECSVELVEDRDELLQHLHDLVLHGEELVDGTMTMSEMSASYVDTLLPYIVGLRCTVRSVTAKAKTSGNHGPQRRLAVARELQQRGADPMMTHFVSPSPDVVVRRATLADVDGIARTHVATWRETYAGIMPDSVINGIDVLGRRLQWQTTFISHTNNVVVHVAVDHRQGIVGFVSGGRIRSHDLPDSHEIYAMYLRKSFQKRGIGGRLFEAIMADLRAAGATSVMLWVLADNPTTGFYEAMGGVAIERRDITYRGATMPHIAYRFLP